MGEIFEDQIFCADLHNGNVNRAPSSPILGHANPKAFTGLVHLGPVRAHALQLKIIQAKFCRIIILANTRKTQSNAAVKAINLGCGQLE